MSKELETRFKAFEAEHDFALPEKSYVLIRIDGRAFHSYTRGFQKPADPRIVDAFTELTVELSKAISNTVFAYTQSDEISLLLCDWKDKPEEEAGAPKKKNETQAFFGNRLQKLVSVASSHAGSFFTRRFPDSPLATFDARAFVLPTKEDVLDYFLWRQLDASRNSVQSAAQAEFGSKKTMNKSVVELKKELADAGKPMSDTPDGVRYGFLIAREPALKTVKFQHKRTGKFHELEVESNDFAVKPMPKIFESEGRPEVQSLIPDAFI